MGLLFYFSRICFPSFLYFTDLQHFLIALLVPKILDFCTFCSPLSQIHIFRAQVQKGVIEVCHCSTLEQLANILTKSMKIGRFVKLRRNLGVVMVRGLLFSVRLQLHIQLDSWLYKYFISERMEYNWVFLKFPSFSFFPKRVTFSQFLISVWECTLC